MNGLVLNSTADGIETSDGNAHGLKNFIPAKYGILNGVPTET
jgi:hypothetical protein